MKAYNIGLNASQTDFQMVILKTYLKYNTKPRVVVQNLDLFSFEMTKGGAIYDPGFWVPYLDEEEVYSFLHRVDRGVWKWKHIPLYGYAVEDMRFVWMWGLLGCFRVNGPEDCIQGYNPRHEEWTEDFEQFRAQNASGVRYAITPEGTRALEGIIEMCRDRGIRMILVYSPEYYEMQSLEVNRDEIVRKFRELAARFEVEFWDYSDSVLSLERRNFRNSQHLNATGATAFSEDLARRLVATGLTAAAAACP